MAAALQDVDHVVDPRRMAHRRGIEHGVIAAVACQALGRLAGHGQGGGIQLAHAGQHVGHRAQVELFPLLEAEGVPQPAILVDGFLERHRLANKLLWIEFAR